MTPRAKTGDVFEVERTPIDVTSNNRPDTAWAFVDPAGHEHRWFVGEVAAASYDPGASYHVPSVVRVVDGYYESDGEEYPLFHFECARCGARVDPGHRADDFQQFIPGLWCGRINGESVSREEFERRWAEANS